MRAIDSARFRLSNFSYNFGWSDWVKYIDGWVPRIASTVPIIGYLIVFNDSVGRSLAFEQLVGSSAQHFLIDADQRLRFVYFGMIALGVSNIWYRLKRPFSFRYGTNDFDFGRVAMECFTFGDFQRIHFRIREKQHHTPYGRYYDSEWDGFKEAALNDGEGTASVTRTADWEDAKRRYGSLLRGMLIDEFAVQNSGRRGHLSLCIVLSTIGYLLLAIPSVELFLRVLASTFSFG